MKAALIGINLDTGDIMSQIFDGDNPARIVHAFKKSIENDWPGYMFTVAADKEAIEVYADFLWGESEEIKSKP